ncbi:MAG: hypothetical protein Q8Q08_12175 [Candidatus Omnitrophota bacterium]|nr:hypothetical protein [Candidatus Omnitrophota bacterium]MDZ4243451.1 hypothetical protein [Candidatus Omnitrophota bacterium]
MNARFLIFVVCLAAAAGSGCAHVTETGKTLWGSSTRQLESARDGAVAKTYRCAFADCFDTVLKLTADLPAGATEEQIKNHMVLFIKNPAKKMIVVMGVPGSVDTTEVGIFFTPSGNGALKVDLSSLSSSAKANAAELVFKQLGQFHEEVK